MSKYGNRKVTLTAFDGQILKFDSQREANRYKDLEMMLQAGEIVEIETQPKFVLLDSYPREGKKIREIAYFADFKITWNDGRITYEDAKGVKTEVYKIKKKMLLFRYPDIIFYEV